MMLWRQNYATYKILGKTFFKLNMTRTTTATTTTTTAEIGFERVGLPKSSLFSVWHALCKVHSETSDLGLKVLSP